MEGELGIDSIKQAEIMSDIRAQFNLELDEDFQIRDYPTLGHVANYVAGSTDSPAKSGESREPKEEENSPAPIFRHVVVTEAMGDIEIHQLPRLVLVTRDPLGLSESLVARITRMGGEARIIEEDSLSDEEIRDACIIQMSSLGAEGSLCTDPHPNHWTIETYNPVSYTHLRAHETG